MTDKNARMWSGSEWVNISAPVSFPNAVVVYQPAAPSSPVVGQVWIDSDDNASYVWDGSSWAVTSLDPSLYAPLDSATLTGSVSVDANATTPALRVTQTGSGPALLVEDSANPDATPFVVTANGKVGVGTLTPDYPLTVQSLGDAQLSLKNPSGTTSAYIGTEGVFGSGSTNDLRIRSEASNILLGFSGAERMRITSAGNVGIGTSSPASELHVRGAGGTSAGTITSEALLHLQDSGGSVGNGGGILYGADQGSFAQIKGFIQDGTANTIGDLTFATRNATADADLTERMRITSAGNVGIGTSSPITKLHISSDGEVVQLIDSSSNLGNIQFRRVNGTQASPTIVSSDDFLGTLQFRGYDGSILRVAAQILASVDGTPGSSDMPGRLSFFTTADGSVTSTERMRINSAGRVGIGTSTPATSLHVGNGTTSTDFTIDGLSAFSGIILRNRADTTSASSVSYIDTRRTDGSIDASIFFIHEVDGGSSLRISTSPAGSKTSDRRVERMRIDSAGNVGIGTTNPANYKLKVEGVVEADNYDIGLTTLASDSIALNFSGETGLYTRTAAGNITFTASNYRVGSIKTVRIIPGAAVRTLTFPASWVFVGAKPTSVAANKTGILTITSFGTTEADCVAAWAVQS
jgi:hypothetical protein